MSNKRHRNRRACDDEFKSGIGEGSPVGASFLRFEGFYGKVGFTRKSENEEIER